MSITLIAAIARNGAIGANGTIPWRAPEDLKHFRDVTMGHAVVMGRRTWESIPEKFRPLPDRENFILTRNNRLDDSHFSGSSAAGSLDIALRYCDKHHADLDVFIIGGAQVYAEALPLADRLLITEVDVEVPDADTFFPNGMLAWSKRSLCGGPHDLWQFETAKGDVTFKLESRRRGEDARLEFCEWRRL